MMKKFVKRSLPYILIIVVFAAIGEFYLIRFKEVTPISKVTDIQSGADNELYFGRMLLSNSMRLYKYEMLKKTRPDVLILGQSVVLQFRDFLFKPFDESFYNSGLMVRNIKDINYTIDLIENNTFKKPELIVLGLDFSLVIKDNVLAGKEWLKNPTEDEALKSQSHIRGIQQIYFGGKIRHIPELNVGFGRAGITGRGYRNDGTYRHKPEMENYLNDSIYHDGDLTQRLKDRLDHFKLPMEYDPERAEKIVKTIRRIKDLDIDVLIYIPAYSDYFFNIAMKDSVFRAFWKKFMGFQGQLITHFDVIPFTTPSQMGLTDNYMVDGAHPGEVLCAKQLLQFLENSTTKSPLLKKIDTNHLEELIRSENNIPISFLKDSIDKFTLNEVYKNR